MVVFAVNEHLRRVNARRAAASRQRVLPLGKCGLRKGVFPADVIPTIGFNLKVHFAPMQRTHWVVPAFHPDSVLIVARSANAICQRHVVVRFLLSSIWGGAHPNMGRLPDALPDVDS